MLFVTRQCTALLVVSLLTPFSIHKVTATGSGTITAEYSVSQQQQHHRRRMGEGDLQEYYDYLEQFSNINATNNLVGGSETDSDTAVYPWFVHFGSKTCAGSLISPNRVLTSATCLQQTGVPSLVRVGATNQRNGILRQVVCAKTYENYLMTEGVAATITGDLAILKLMTPVQNVEPVLLHTGTGAETTANLPLAEQSLLALGMGLNPNLEQVELDFVSTEDCQQDYGLDGTTIIQPSVHLCAIGKKKGLCTGDSGSPLVVVLDDEVIQVGVASFTYGDCGDKSIPDVFTSVAYYSQWIQTQLVDDSCDGDPTATMRPSQMPSLSTTPSISPSRRPSTSPSPPLQSSDSPSPSSINSELWSSNPSSLPTLGPSSTPSSSPSLSSKPSDAPSHSPTNSPTTPLPTPLLSSNPSSLPTLAPSSGPSSSPSLSSKPSDAPSHSPTNSPTTPLPTPLLSSNPSFSPTLAPSSGPSSSPSLSSKPSDSPSNSPTNSPTSSSPTPMPTSSSPTPMPTPAPLVTAAEQLIEVVGNIVQWKEEWKQNFLPGWFHN